MSQSHYGVPSWWQRHSEVIIYLLLWFGLVFCATAAVIPG